MKRLRSFGVCVVVLAAVLVLFGGLVRAADSNGGKAAPAKPTPTAEHKRLGYFVGKWNSTADMKESPYGPGGKMTSQDTCEWFDGGFAVICRGNGKGPTGPMKSLAILGYNADEKAYTYYGLDNTAMDMTTVPKGKVEGGTWTYDDTSTYQGQTIKSRYTLKEISPTSYTFKWEMEGPSGWTTLGEGTSTKVGAAAKSVKAPK